MKDKEYYIRIMSNLHTDRGIKKYSSITKHRAPHKPLLILSVIDLIEEGKISHNFIELNPELGETFANYWGIIMPNSRGKIVYPFFFLKTESFWHLVPITGKESILSSMKEVSSISHLLEFVSGAKLDDEFFTLLTNKINRDIIRSVIINNYFDSIIANQLIIQSSINIESFKYSAELLQKRMKIQEPVIDEKVRDQGFRKAVVSAYDHRCAFCGIRIRTHDGHTVVDGAHIIPWAVTQNDSPQNGLCLCKLCHWTFDEGLLTLTTDYQIHVSRIININDNIVGYLTSFHERDMFKPVDEFYLPAEESIIYHRDRSKENKVYY
jgi:putative restriction endonuclease